MSASHTQAPAGGTAAPAGATFEPVMIGFTCNWCSYRAADLAGTARIKYPPNVRLIRLMCSGRLDPAFVLKAFAEGADGVMISGCWPGECHYIEQNYKALRRFTLLRRVIEAMGIEPARLQLVWASAAEGQRFANEVGRVVEEVRALGPLHWGRDGARPPASVPLDLLAEVEIADAEAVGVPAEVTA
jgi:F420-non-reducing hydrogenase iron-sulfur subunit